MFCQTYEQIVIEEIGEHVRLLDIGSKADI